jgi:hypothetical protein
LKEECKGLPESQKKAGKQADADTKHGKYLLQTSLDENREEKKVGIHHEWSEVVRILSTHKIVSTCM